MTYGCQAVHISLFLFQNNFTKFDIEQTEYSYQNINNWITKKIKNDTQLYDNLSLCNRGECIIAACFKSQGHTFCAHTTMERNLSNNGDLKAA